MLTDGAFAICSDIQSEHAPIALRRRENLSQAACLERLLGRADIGLNRRQALALRALDHLVANAEYYG